MSYIRYKLLLNKINNLNNKSHDEKRVFSEWEVFAAPQHAIISQCENAFSPVKPSVPRQASGHIDTITGRTDRAPR
jgi:hypothetical protein